jgi:hypothetical protein
MSRIVDLALGLGPQIEQILALPSFADWGTAPPARLIGARDAARILGISVPALRKRVQRGDLPRGAVVYTGRRYQFRRDRLIP